MIECTRVELLGLISDTLAFKLWSIPLEIEQMGQSYGKLV